MQHRDDRREEADDHRDPGRVDRQVEHVAAELVGPERVLDATAAPRRGPVAVTAVWSGPDEERRGDRARTVKTTQDRDPDQAVRPARAAGAKTLARSAGDAPATPARPATGIGGRRHVRTRGSRKP